MTYTEDQLVPLSALQHLVFCERQCALIHVEQVWAENRLTVEGKGQHARVDQSKTESRCDVRTAFGVRLRSLRLGLAGRADAVEFHRVETKEVGARLPDTDGYWLPFPVEHKHGRPKSDLCDEIQLCAQALCLEEMLAVHIPAGALFYGTPRRRADVAFDAVLRRATEDAAARLHALLDSGTTPPPGYGPKCRNCSLVEVCMPRAAVASHSARGYLEQALHS